MPLYSYYYSSRITVLEACSLIFQLTLLCAATLSSWDACNPTDSYLAMGHSLISSFKSFYLRNLIKENA